MSTKTATIPYGRQILAFTHTRNMKENEGNGTRGSGLGNVQHHVTAANGNVIPHH